MQRLPGRGGGSVGLRDETGGFRLMQITAAQEEPSKTYLYDDGDGKIDIMGVDETHSTSSEAGKGSMHSALPQHLAVDAVIGCGGNGSDHVGRINVLDVNTLWSQAQLQYLAGPSIKLGKTSNTCHAKRATS